MRRKRGEGEEEKGEEEREEEGRERSVEVGGRKGDGGRNLSVSHRVQGTHIQH